ncbi:MAG: efflux RND transporter periplasmic adaptor subunit [Magnetococcales bacterium]|nr:efflux RND transporter periplasmic adaptor subunit [Magnetococcales bacterium]NGZ27066.1 efflux RND transporter periplasmic adaptor subunit [Magnetococcales bacterium]
MQSGNIITVQAGSIGSTSTLGGTVVPLKEVSFSAQLPGRVVFLAGVEGDWFKAGTVLLALNDDDLLAQEKAALANLRNAEANLRNSRVQYTRQVMTGPDSADAMGMGMPKMMDDMFAKPMSSMVGRDNPEIQRRAQIYAQGTQIDAARSAITQAKAKLQEIEARLRDTKSIAPFSGVIVRKSVEKGDTVQPGMPLLAFADTRNLQIQVDVPARLMPGIQKGMIIPAKLDVGNTRIQTRVAQIYPMADAQRHTVTVKLDLPQDAPGGPGMYAEVMVPDITTPIQNLPMVPKSAVVWRGSLPAIYVMTATNEPELRMVRLGSFVDDQTVGVLSGIQVGERIFTTPPSNVPDTWKSEQPSKEGSKK